jgi:hypothetical protein
VRTIIVETANRFARDLIVQETGHRMLKAQGIEIIAADSPGAFVEDTPTATLVRQVLGAVAQFDKAMTVAKLRLARDRIRKRDGKCEGASRTPRSDPRSLIWPGSCTSRAWVIGRSASSSSAPATSMSAANRFTTRACAPCWSRRYRRRLCREGADRRVEQAAGG